MRTGARGIVVSVIALALCGVARAVVYSPDGSHRHYDDPFEFRRDLSTEEIEDLEGQVLASRVTPFEIREYSEEAGRELLVEGSLTEEVVREAETGYLSFHYRVIAGPRTNDTTDFEGLTLTGFGTWFTDFRSDLGDGLDFAIHRLDGGNTFFYYVQEDFGHKIVVRTDAPDFAEGGTFHYSVDWDGWGEDGSARLGTFRPVPEPAGLLTLPAAALLLRRRRPSRGVAPPRAAAR